ncbi:Uncharacterised protein [Actinobacillus ureae]|uniref:hypothetical protein n=1 Tax=Actinobacillus ureae TaxID=723 RepID=UPI000E11D02A|nr:hypothetical protein [Actinobacillus ureae]SUT85387.1 Uncharacterised protein [Actinobacillus ureae]SUU42468.1 Uncharacterised protein [Actinobacillus ureae]
MTVDQQRQAFVAQLLGMTGNTKRTKLWDEFGYPRRIDFNQFYKVYKRFALGNAAVERIIEKCWEDYPTVIEGAESEEATTETSWEKEVKAFLTKNWQSIIEADRRNLVGRYSALILQVADGKQWHEPIEDGSLSNLGIRGLVKFIFVTPHRWIGKEKWVTEKKSLNKWKDVKVYDTNDLEQWLEQSLPAQS